MKIGLNLSHESSVALTDEFGLLIFALEEERLSRRKGQGGFPFCALMALLTQIQDEQITEVIIGSTSKLNINDAALFYGEFRVIKNTNSKLISDIENINSHWSTGFALPKQIRGLHPNIIVEKIIFELMAGVGITYKIPTTWITHHNGHLGCALGMTGVDPTLILSLDGEGDWESGAVAFSRNRKVANRKMVSTHLDSIGHLYSQVTSKYGYTPARHEGKITGLAAYGKYSAASQLLANSVLIRDGIIKLKYIQNSSYSKIVKKLRNLGLPINIRTSIEDIVSYAAKEVEVWPDLAWAIQNTLENTVIELVDFWVDKFDVRHLSLSGGVFANVKLNQRLAEMKKIDTVQIFPNMGDGGLSVGGIWWELSSRSQLSDNQLFSDMYLSDTYFNSKYKLNSNDYKGRVKFTELTSKIMVERIVEQLISGKYVGIHQAGCEFGPRALGNRSILFDARNANLGKTLNKRLKRTEFMPFAPVVLEEKFSTYFETTNKSLTPFYFMTMTCNVKNDKIVEIPAVVHIDKTARPQIISQKSNQFLYEILSHFFKKTGVPILVNTSLNMHEEPINGALQDSLKTLLVGGIDLLVTNEGIYEVV